MRPLLSRLDPWLYRYPFQGRSAERYAQRERCGFGNLDARLLIRLQDDLARARVFLDVGAGPGWFARQLRQHHPLLRVVTLEPSRDLVCASAGITALRGIAEALPLADDSVDLALCLSSIRHVSRRHDALRELRRVVRPGGVLYIVELDPEAPRRRVRAHARNMRSLSSRLAFGPLVVRTAPSATDIAHLAARAGWSGTTLDHDREQPVYILRLS